MRYYYSRSLARLTTGLNSIPLNESSTFIRGDSASIELQIYSGQEGAVVIEELHDFTMRFGVRPLDKYREDTELPTVLTSRWEWLPLEQCYRAYPAFSGELIDALFPAAEDLTSPPSVQLHAEIEIVTSSPYSRTTIIIGEITLLNDLIQGDESEPPPEEVSDYLLKSEASAKYLPFDEAATLTSEEKLNVRTAIGAAAAGGVVLTTAQELTLEQKEQVAENLGYSLEAITAVKYTAQTLTSPQQAQVRANIGDPPTNDDITARLAALGANVVKNTAQSFSPEQKARTRLNIGAAASDHTHPDRPALYRRVIAFEPEGNGTAIQLLGAKHTASGTPTARDNSIFATGITVTAIDGFTNVVTAPGHGLFENEYVQFSAVAFPTPLAANTWYQVSSVTTDTFTMVEVSSSVDEFGETTYTTTPIDLDETFTTLKVLKYGRLIDRCRRIGFVSAATANAAAGTRHALAQWLIGNAPIPTGIGYEVSQDTRLWRYTAIFAPTDAAAVANARMFVGFAANTTAMPSANPSTFSDCYGIGQDSGSDYLKVIGGVVTGTSVGNTTGLQLVRHRPYKLTIERAANGTLTGVLQALDPVDSTNAILYYMTWGRPGEGAPKLVCPHLWRSNGSTTLSVGIDVLTWSLESDY